MLSIRSCLVIVIGAVALASPAHAQPAMAPPSSPIVAQPGVAPTVPAAPNLQLRAPDYLAAKLEIQQLRSRSPSLAGPITTTVVGGAVAYAALSATSYIEAYRFFKGADSVSTRPLTGLYITAGSAALVAGAGVIWLIVTLRERRAIKSRIRELMLSIPANGQVHW